MRMTCRFLQTKAPFFASWLRVILTLYWVSIYCIYCIIGSILSSWVLLDMCELYLGATGLLLWVLRPIEMRMMSSAMELLIIHSFFFSFLGKMYIVITIMTNDLNKRISNQLSHLFKINIFHKKVGDNRYIVLCRLSIWVGDCLDIKELVGSDHEPNPKFFMFPNYLSSEFQLTIWIRFSISH